MKDRIAFLLATAFGLGLSPILPGTCAALVGLGIHIGIVNILPVQWQWHAILAAFLFFSAMTLLLNEWAENYWKKSDHQSFVTDEIAGYLFVPVLYTAVPTTQTFIWGFVLFRVLDMIKIPPANIVDKQLKNKHGVLLDDLISASYAYIIMMLIL